jgi:hypothetical protein
MIKTFFSIFGLCFVDCNLQNHVIILLPYLYNYLRCTISISFVKCGQNFCGVVEKHNFRDIQRKIPQNFRFR